MVIVNLVEAIADVYVNSLVVDPMFSWNRRRLVDLAEIGVGVVPGADHGEHLTVLRVEAHQGAVTHVLG